MWPASISPVCLISAIVGNFLTGTVCCEHTVILLGLLLSLGCGWKDNLLFPERFGDSIS